MRLAGARDEFFNPETKTYANKINLKSINFNKKTYKVSKYNSIKYFIGQMPW
jgi:hypothetical protein